MSTISQPEDVEWVTIHLKDLAMKPARRYVYGDTDSLRDTLDDPRRLSSDSLPAKEGA